MEKRKVVRVVRNGALKRKAQQERAAELLIRVEQARTLSLRDITTGNRSISYTY